MSANHWPHARHCAVRLGYGCTCAERERQQKAIRAIWIDGPDSEARRAARSNPRATWARLNALASQVDGAVTRDGSADRGEFVRLDPVQGVGFRPVEPSCGELGLELDVMGAKGTMYVSREMWTALGHSMGWCQDDVSDGMRRLGERVLEEATSALQWYRGGMRVAQAPRLSRAAALHIADMAWRLGVGEDPHPDTTHTPAVRRVVALAGCTGTGEHRAPGFGWFYRDDADRIRPRTCTADAAAYLRHRDEKAGCR